ncbi:MAG TPA: NifB/NifX family molybdenum-iron cluster-binding protein [Bacillota bacterium]|nr:NifB/NifX family molybdenum-iron cluster-binding protein [Bacillota bacterium]
MKVAIATEQGMVSEHFGHCEGFTIYELEQNQVKSQKFYTSPEHVPGALPNFLNDLGIKVVIAGGMGGGAIQIFNEKQIEVITGVTGNLDTTINKYISGNLHSSGSVCHQHQHAGECGH